VSIAAAEITAVEARALTDQVRADAAALWAKLLALYERGAHTALGYSSWGAYYEAEFGQAKSQAYRVLEAARVVEALPEAHSPMGERVARELVPVLRDEPERVAEVWRQVVREHGEQPTAAQVRGAVRNDSTAAAEARMTAPLTERQRQVVDKAKERVERAVGTCNGLARGLDWLKVEAVIENANPTEVEGWDECFRDAISAISRMRRRVKSASAGEPPPAPEKVRCPTCGHKVRPDDFKRGI
jgi:hypothetical protein